MGGALRLGGATPGNEIEAGLGAALGVALGDVVGVAGDHQQLGIPDRLLPTSASRSSSRWSIAGYAIAWVSRFARVHF
jgi:hypothetical protein